MCGFIGFTTYLEDQQKKRDVLQRMMNRIVHRGPDMADSYIDPVSYTHLDVYKRQICHR